ncbi:hypothetical protein TTHERM_00189140 (macronuclear) [Tetrahymena thermophila SB210]|uniref:Leucine rich repeat protein n=1 Tax=Tetrahymena thermophila (strain SB210) TaxID=312017 RepID=I7MJH4_TETTS|nr:hypothetical protein TTHERM_00189140 [Tetrahymena thermophila SB210]EAR96345.2 hypothetical protein TTHERM_00189140 [Tetrahymena thermophila SB210]|eukprot:XP_001016590.2 hypothetical protein TTHERM_00189140 [Tetrahymena thermophila SB210]
MNPIKLNIKPQQIISDQNVVSPNFRVSQGIVSISESTPILRVPTSVQQIKKNIIFQQPQQQMQLQDLSPHQLSGSNLMLKRSNSNQLKQLRYEDRRTPQKSKQRLPDINSSNNNNSNSVINQKKTSGFSNLLQQNKRVETSPIQSAKNIYSNQSTISLLNNPLNNSLITSELQEIFVKEKDERFRYLMKHGSLKKIENNGGIIFSELQQIPGIWVCYRRPSVREQQIEKLNLDKLELSHIPLLEGEEKLKILSYQHNKIVKVENLVSLPNLLYLDLYNNNIKEIENLNSLVQLKVLLLPKNQIQKIKNIEMLQKLEVLDLHSNKIAKIEGVHKLINLKVLNLANNLIQKVENLENNITLTELNLKINLIDNLLNFSQFPRLSKLYLSNNKINEFNKIKDIKLLTQLNELNLEGNPISKQRPEYLLNILEILPESTSIIDHKSVAQFKEELDSLQNQLKTIKQQPKLQINNEKISNNVSLQDQINLQSNNNRESTPAKNIFKNDKDTKDVQSANNINEDMQPQEVINVIKQQWIEEEKRVKELDAQSAQRKSYLKNSKIEGGHAEIEEDGTYSLYVYGNAYEIVLSNPLFQENIERIQLQYILFDNLVENNVLSQIKNFKKLKEIILKDNHITSLLQLAKLEMLQNLKFLTIENSVLNKCSFFKEFVVYRFPFIQKFNGKEIRDVDKLKAKQIFNNFDKILQLPDKYYNISQIREYANDQQTKKDKQYVKVFTKTVSSQAEEFVSNILSSHVVEEYEEQQCFDQNLDLYILELLDDIVN